MSMPCSPEHSSRAAKGGRGPSVHRWSGGQIQRGPCTRRSTTQQAGLLAVPCQCGHAPAPGPWCWPLGPRWPVVTCLAPSFAHGPRSPEGPPIPPPKLPNGLNLQLPPRSLSPHGARCSDRAHCPLRVPGQIAKPQGQDRRPLSSLLNPQGLGQCSVPSRPPANIC